MASRCGAERARSAWRILSASALLLAAGCAVGSRSRQAPPVGAEGAPETAAQVHWREYKLPLRPERVTEPGAAAAALRALSESTAERHGGVVAPQKKAPKPAREEVAVLDTPDQSLRRRGLVLRRHGRTGATGGTATHEMTLKSRSPDIRTARAAPVEAAGGLPSSFDFKEEVLVDPGTAGGSRPMWSLESRVRRTGGARELTLADVVEVFPGTAGLGDPSTPVSSVGGIRIEQTEVELPAITFGSVAVRPSLIVWRDRDAGVVIAAEYAFTEKIADYWHQPAADVSAIRAYFAALQRAAADWVAPTTTKTAAVYAWATARAASGR